MNAAREPVRDALHRFRVLSAPIEVVHREPSQLLGYRSLAISKEATLYNANSTSENFPFDPRFPRPALSPAARNKSRMHSASDGNAQRTNTVEPSLGNRTAGS